MIINYYYDKEVFKIAINYFENLYRPNLLTKDVKLPKIELDVQYLYTISLSKSPDGIRHKFKKILYYVEGYPYFEELDVKRYSYGDNAFISSACVKKEDKLRKN